jgi:hypothetical protein
MTAVSSDTLFIAATILQSGRIGSTFEWALGEAIDNMDHFAQHDYTAPLKLSSDCEPVTA